MIGKYIKKISFFLLICFVSSLLPEPALAASIDDVFNKLTPQQKNQAESLIQEKGNQDQIKNLLEKDNSLENEDKNKEQDKDKDKEVLITKSITDEIKALIDNLSPIEKSFNDEEIRKIKEQQRNKKNYNEAEPTEEVFDKSYVEQKLLRQYGYEVFKKAVDDKFSLVPSIPIGPDYRINPGDKLLITIWGNVNDSFSLLVDERGSVTIPKVGVVTVVGLTILEARDLLYQRLAKIFVADFNIDLTIKEIGSIKVYMVGEFKNPGAYTILANTSLYDAVFIGGGPTKNGTLRKIELIRNGMKIVTVDFYDFILKGKNQNDILLESGDVIKISPIQKVVAVSGNINRSAIYELKNKTELSDLISLAGGVTPTSYLHRIQIGRKVNNVKETVVDSNYADYLKTKNYKPIYVDSLDYVSIFSIEPEIRNVVYLKGNVIRPGRYELSNGMNLMDLFIKADGLAPYTYMERAQIYRAAPPKREPEILVVNLNKMKAGDPQNNPLLKEFDQIRVYADSEIKGEPKVYISGEINDEAVNEGTGAFPLVKNMRISDLIFLAGGVKSSAFLNKAELVRTDEKNISKSYEINLSKILKEKDKKEDFLLQENDYLFIRKIPDYGFNEKVTIKGNVLYPGKYVISRGERLSVLIERAGGLTEKAFLAGAVFIRESVKLQQTEKAAKMIKELEIRKGWEFAQIPVGLPKEERDFRHQQVEGAYEFSLKKISMEASGRIILNLSDLKSGANNDIILQDGDYLEIPEKIYSVDVMGEVYFPGSILYENGKSVDYYIDACGGRTDFADRGRILVLKANGKIENSYSVGMGDTVFIPAKTIELVRYQDPFDWNKFWESAANATNSFAQAATALVTVYLLYKEVNK